MMPSPVIRGWGQPTDINKNSDNTGVPTQISAGSVTVITSTTFRHSNTSKTHLPQTIATRYQRNDWKLAISASSYQTVDKSIAATDYPYTRLPQLVVDWRPSPRSSRLNYMLHASATDFRHDSKESARRLHLRPSVSYPIQKEYGFLIPKISAYASAYANRTAGTDRLVTVPVSSLDGGLVFERKTGKSQSMVQTLEPRLYYVYAPSVFQDNLPLFDSSLPTFTFNSLFYENRFLGSDRVGDSNQLTMALTSRLIDDQTGSQRISASIGQTFYFADRQVNLPSGSVTESRSDVAAEVSAWLGKHWYARSTLQWRPQTGSLKKNNQYLQYQPAKDSIVNLGYRYEDGVQELVDISTQWPIAKKWTLLARSQYSLKDGRNLDSYAGLLYDTCCWSLRTMLSRRTDQNSAQVNSLSLQIILKGLAGFESGIISETPLQQSVFR